METKIKIISSKSCHYFFLIFGLILPFFALAQGSDESTQRGVAGFNKTIRFLNLSLFSFFVVSILIFLVSFFIRAFASGNEKMIKIGKVLFVGAVVFMVSSLIGYVFTNLVKYYLL